MIKTIINKKSLFAFSIFILTIFCSTSAFALDLNNLTDLFTVPSGDVSASILKSLFGALPSLGGAGTDAFQQPIATFNQLVLIVGGVLAAYGILTGTVMTAHEGEVAGRSIHSVWYPIRTAIGSALILPVFNGYCTIQVLVMWCVLQGVGLADAVWATFTSSSNLSNMVSVSYNGPDVNKLAHDIVKAEMCMAAINTFYNSPAEQGGNPNLLPQAGINMAVTPVTSTDSAPADMFNGAPASSITSTIYKFGNSTGAGGISVDYCGTVTVTPMTIASATANTSSTSQSLAWSIGATGPYTQQNINNINQAQSQAIQTMISDAQSLVSTTAQTIYSDSKNGISLTGSDIQSFNSSIDTMIGHYNQTVHAAAANAMNSAVSFSDISAEAQQDGWALAGAWFMKFMYLQDRTQQAIANVPTSSAINSIPSDMMGDLGSIYMSGLNILASNSSVSGDYGITDDANKQSFVKDGDMGAAVTRLVGKALNFSINDNDNPVMTVKRLGDWMITVAGALATVKIATTAGVVGKVLSFVGISDLITIVLSPIIMFLICLGFISSYIIPVMPFIMWFGIVTAYIILCVEAVIAAPLWCVMLLNPQANGLLGEQKRGLQMVLNLMLRPTVMIFGLAASIILIQVMGTLLNHIFSSVWVMSQSSSNILVAILGAGAGVLVYDVMAFLLIKKLFGAITQIPDQLFNWIGGSPVGLESASSKLTAGMMQLNTHIGSAANQLRNIGGGAMARAIPNTTQTPPNLLSSSTTQQKTEGSSNSGSTLSAMENSQNDSKTDETLGGMAEHSPNLAEAFSESGVMSNIGNSQERKDSAIGFNSMVDQAHSMLGGSQSQASQAYSENLAEAIKANPFMNKGQMAHQSNSALVSSMDHAYGSGATAITSAIATKQDGSISRTQVGNTAQTYKSLMGAMNNAGVDSSSQAAMLGTMNSKTLEASQVDTNTSMSQHLQNHATQVIAGLGTSNSDENVE
ncbi:conjugal transfer/type IV secretion DotA/TraY family protein [Paraburkholderia xenovorans LB400]|uniref:Uncharacterized protein n=1 Tax=Paraburkholderia xenovorans (strain LB400) TaxID=266265 RepID=Q145D6_PARXL|nr:DotA/TraY family protein [Paraburkholderia xenovorans]ABE29053.1 hypothetical protein Bxe_A3946 [Paraburkholderia xenovorans LB400]AIP33715.1 conjugal transfer/type IV secretion DotA/TraY family protein [Paraburkholderia xenovorans LB400]